MNQSLMYFISELGKPFLVDKHSRVNACLHGTIRCFGSLRSKPRPKENSLVSIDICGNQRHQNMYTNRALNNKNNNKNNNQNNQQTGNWERL